MKRGAGSTSVRKSSTWGWVGGWALRTRGVTTLPGALVRKRGRRVGSRRAEQACPRARRAAAQRESEGRPPRQGTRGRRAIRISTAGPLAPSLGDQVVNHVIVVGRVTGPLAPCRRARPSSDRVGATRAQRARRSRHSRATCVGGTLCCQAEDVMCCRIWHSISSACLPMLLAMIHYHESKQGAPGDRS